jgi:acyloxyacyl hydrolase
LKLCEDTPGQPKCRLYPSNKTLSVPHQALNLRRRHPEINSHLSKGKICQFPGIKEICKIIENIFGHQLPEIDLDHDKFGTEQTLRGGSWRGRDCHDTEAKVHPGAHAVQGDVSVDHNCNGIHGVDSKTGKAWEDEFCNDTNRMGIAILGDSVAAHFHLPEQWLDARNMSEEAFEHLLFILENELDWPQMSASTGHVNISWPNMEG